MTALKLCLISTLALVAVACPNPSPQPQPPTPDADATPQPQLDAPAPPIEDGGMQAQGFCARLAEAHCAEGLDPHCVSVVDKAITAGISAKLSIPVIVCVLNASAPTPNAIHACGADCSP